MHIVMQRVTCPACDCPPLYETYKILRFLAAYPGVLARFPGVTASRYGARLHTPPEYPVTVGSWRFALPCSTLRTSFSFSHQRLVMLDGGLPYCHLPHVGANVGYGKGT
ncbi:hypothetical protein SPRG_09059 [Saprolegnia parasitica CBS 223.65]|uniref:Uncharacterized protein n=1 Tax=Saprolegnia parasitica (strain CBS 223.65) TaxID=695850 RepID=A0A067CG34_SAPPC|nr:hypothetical protein SPRG_09059 [Saprolegnia parasitica CBS 223.65]KDO25762.1 hypothetical protein SPRG_09059 [Saprolegnia parasitica CBS 223.65]|eukprot:XP_012203569.1 hypothetical protein SPRG_09059 [Saprolegnia parasitica CBS 223.65]